jgi:hypothetical protein
VPEVVNEPSLYRGAEIVCRKLNIQHLKERKDKSVEFAKVKDNAIDKVMELIRLGNGKVGIDQRAGMC